MPTSILSLQRRQKQLGRLPLPATASYAELLEASRRRREWIARRLEEGVRPAAIARELGVSRQRVGQLIGRIRHLEALARVSQKAAA